MDYKRLLIAAAFAFGSSVSAATNETFENASQVGKGYFAYQPLGFSGHADLGQSRPEFHNLTAPVLEPETYALMACGLIVVVAVARRRRPR